MSIVNDALDEPDETFVISLGAPTNATPGTPTSQTVTITEDDEPPAVNLMGGFTPTSGDKFPIISWGGYSGSFTITGGTFTPQCDKGGLTLIALADDLVGPDGLRLVEPAEAPPEDADEAPAGETAVARAEAAADAAAADGPWSWAAPEALAAAGGGEVPHGACLDGVFTEPVAPGAESPPASAPLVFGDAGDAFLLADLEDLLTLPFRLLAAVVA